MNAQHNKIPRNAADRINRKPSPEVVTPDLGLVVDVVARFAQIRNEEPTNNDSVTILS